jgi:hypothetical protein
MPESASGETAHEHELRLNGMRANPKHRLEASASSDLLYRTVCLHLSSDMLQSWLRERSRACAMPSRKSCRTSYFRRYSYTRNKGVRIVHDALHDTGYLHVSPRPLHVRGWLLHTLACDTSNAGARVKPTSHRYGNAAQGEVTMAADVRQQVTDGQHSNQGSMCKSVSGSIFLWQPCAWCGHP